MFEIHPSARENFDAKVALLLGRIASAPRVKARNPRFEPEVHVAATITDKEILGEPREAVTDYRGKTVGRFFIFAGKRYGLIDESHEELVKLAESIQKLPAFRDSLSKDFVEECIFLWLGDEFGHPGNSGSFMQFLTSEASRVVKQITVFVPVANTVVEAAFQFYGTTIRNMTKAMVDDLASIGESLPDEENRKSATKFFDEFRKEYQGYVVVEIGLTCEPSFANDLGIDTASRITDLLGIYSGAVLMPDVKCVSRIRGTENLGQYTTVTKAQDGGLSIQKGILDRASARQWLISKADLAEYSRCGLDVISNIASREQRTEFESTVLNMAFLYSKAAFTSDPMEKLVHMLSALESTLLRNESEPIQQNLAERLAFFTSQELLERKGIIRNVRHVYGLRSRYLHHGHSSSELKELSTFFVRVWIFYVQLVVNSGRFKTKSEFLDAIDDHKLT